MKKERNRPQQYIHPFPARMAPEIALAEMASLHKGAKVLDPMAGSGTVPRIAAQNGLTALGFDMDPLAVLMSQVSTKSWRAGEIAASSYDIFHCAKSLGAKDLSLPWIDNCEETKKFIDYWFAPRQKLELRKLAYSIFGSNQSMNCLAMKKAMAMALSRIIVTKSAGASLAWDVSHSRPHRVMDSNDFDVLEGFVRAAETIDRRLSNCAPLTGTAVLRRGDARNLVGVSSASVDAVITSPPYLNAIDYMRGHRLALVWLGFSVTQLRQIRANSIGAERSIAISEVPDNIDVVRKAFGKVDALPTTLGGIVNRYARDLIQLMSELSRVTTKEGAIHLVVGDSKLRGVKISNSRATIAAAELCGLKLVNSRKRRIPASQRYLPTSGSSQNQVHQRMMYEHVISFRPS